MKIPIAERTVTLDCTGREVTFLVSLSLSGLEVSAMYKKSEAERPPTDQEREEMTKHAKRVFADFGVDADKDGTRIIYDRRKAGAN